MVDIPKRLRVVDTRLAQVDRRIGDLSARLFFQPIGGQYAEVPTFTHKDSGLTAKNWRTGTEVQAWRHTFTFNKAWWETQSGGHGTYAIQVAGGELLPCTVESQLTQDDSPDVTIDIAIIQSTPTF